MMSVLPGNDPSFIRTLLALIFVIALIFIFAIVYRRLLLRRSGAQYGGQILMTLPLGTRERLVLVEMQDQRLLLGVTPQAISVLHVFPEREP